MSFLGGGLALAVAPPTEAQISPAAWQIEAGAFLSYHFGGREPGHLGFSLEMRELHARREFGCDASFAGSFGMVQRLAMLGWDQFRLTVGARGGMEGRILGGGGEVAGGFRVGSESGPLLYLGVEAGMANAAFARLSYVPRGDASVGIGAIFPSNTLGICGGGPVPGRPLRRTEQRVPLPTTGFANSVGCIAPDSAEGAAALVWLERAAAEWASVPAFLELAEQLAWIDAPRVLVRRACSAAVDESRHAVLSATIASTLGGAAVEIVPSALAARSVACGQAGLERLAVESFRDGCIGEDAAAAWASAEAESARSPFVRLAQTSIAADEAGHAALAWDVVVWTLARGGAAVRDALLDTADNDRLVAAAAEDSNGSPESLCPYGCLPAKSRFEIHRRQTEAARRQLHTII